MRKFCLALVALAVMSGFAAAESFTDPVAVAETRIAPDYPPAAQAARFQGSVTVAALINTDGSVGAVEVIDSSSPNLGFEQAAMDAIKQWEFSPARLDGEPVDAVFAYAFHFEPAPARSDIPAYVSGYYLASVALGGVPGGPGKPTVERGGGLSLAAYAMDRIQKVNLPPGQLGALYDRRDLIPAPRSGKKHTTQGALPNK